MREDWSRLMAERESLEGDVVYVTGAGSGLGEATARAFAGTGCRIAAIDRNGDAVTHLVRSLPVTTPEHLAISCDVSDAERVQHSVDTVLHHFGRVDIVVNCAAIDHTYWLEQLTVEQWDQVIGVNLRGPFLVSKAVWSHMRQQGGGHIFNIASTSAYRAASGATAYCASKFGMLGFSRALNLEGRQDNIRVTTIIPGGMQTNFFDRFAAQGIPGPDPAILQDPAHVARTILFAAQMPPGSDLQELVVTSPGEPGWP
jgi:NAD(P)-dependent dehydrogenase (short-subunit alcohol dehydrogenase family)